MGEKSRLTPGFRAGEGEYAAVAGAEMIKSRRKEIKHKVLNFYREKANSDLPEGQNLSNYLEQFGLTETEKLYGFFIAQKFIDRVQIEPFPTVVELIEKFLNDLD